MKSFGKKLLVLLVLMSIAICWCAVASAEKEQVLQNPTCAKDGVKAIYDDNGNFLRTEPILATGEHDFKESWTQATCTENRKVGVFCTVCGAVKEGTTPVEKPGTKLGHAYDSVVTDPDCIHQGYTTKTCSRCGDVVVTDYVEPIGEQGHNYTEWVLLEAPDCAKKLAGSRKSTCTICEHVLYEEIPYSEGHESDEGVITTPATCTEAGVKTFTCKLCNTELRTEGIKALGHHFVEKVEQATCTENRIVGMFCDRCNEWDQEHTHSVPGSKLPHDFIVTVAEATCSAPKTITTTCSRCDYEDVVEEGEPDPDAHKWGDWVNLEEPDCVNELDGSQKKVCEYCKFTYYDVIHWQDSHEADEGVITTPATCTADGVKTFSCIHCGTELYTEPVLKIGHNWVEKTQHATCTEGKKVGIFCTICEQWDEERTVSEEDGALGHDYIVNEEEATCVSAKKITTTCSRCDYEDIAYQGEKNPDAHAFGDAEVIETPNCATGAKGTQKTVCELCGFAVYEELEAEHEADDGVVTLDPTCVDPGTREYYCKYCGEFMYDEEIDPTGEHDFQLITWPATCTEAKKTGSLCIVCGTPENDLSFEYDFDFPPLDHDYIVTVAEATCIAPKTITTTCSRCDYEDVVVEGEPNPDAHEWGEPELIEAPVCKTWEKGSQKITCIHESCGASVIEFIEPEHVWDMNGEIISEGDCGTGEWGRMKTRCTVCGRLEIIDIEPQHTYETVYKNGKLVKVCSKCGDVQFDGHAECVPGEPVIENEVPATCAVGGSYDEVIYCIICGEEISRETKTTEKTTEHTPGEPVKENEVAATCVKAGSYDEVVYCTVCEEELSREAKETEKAPHTPGEPVKENETATSYDEVIYCDVCGDELSRETKEIENPAVKYTVNGSITKSKVTLSWELTQGEAERGDLHVEYYMLGQGNSYLYMDTELREDGGSMNIPMSGAIAFTVKIYSVSTGEVFYTGTEWFI